MYFVSHNQLKPILTYFRNRLVPNDICFSILLSFWYFCNSLQVQVLRENSWHCYRLRRETYITFLCLLSTINDKPVSIDIKMFVVGPYCIYKVVLVRKPLKCEYYSICFSATSVMILTLLMKYCQE